MTIAGVATRNGRTAAIPQGCSTLFSESLVQQVAGIEARRAREDSAGQKSLNLCRATESLGGRLAVIRAPSFATRDNPRPPSRRGQAIPTTTRATVFDFRHGQRRKLVS